MGSLTLRTVLDEVLLMSGNGFIDDLDTVGFSEKQFLSIVRKSLRTYIEYRNFNGTLSITSSSYIIDMKDHFQIPPSRISQVMVSGTLVAYRYMDHKLVINGFVDSDSIIKITYLLDDKMSILHCTDDSQIDSVDSWVLGFDSQDNRLAEFLDLVNGNFMIALGRAVRRFRIEEMPIGLDGDSLVSEGERDVEKMIQQLQETSDSYDNMLEMPSYQVHGGGGLRYGTFRFP